MSDQLMKLELHLQSVPAKIKINPSALGLSFGFSPETILSFSKFIRRWYLIYFFIFQLSTFVHLTILLALCVEWYEIAEVTSIISFTCSALITFPFFFLLNKDIFLELCKRFEVWFVFFNSFCIPCFLTQLLEAKKMSVKYQVLFISSWVPIAGWLVFSDAIPRSLGKDFPVFLPSTRQAAFGSITSILFFLLVGIWFWEPFGDQMIKWSICKPFLISDLLQASIFSSLFFCLKYLHHTFFYPEYFIIHSAKLKLEEKYVKQEITSQPYNTMESIVAETTLSQIPL